MKREEKYKDHTYFHYYNANPKDRKTCDCVIRAICTSTGKTWRETFRDLAEIGIRYGYMLNGDRCIKKYLESLGYVKCKEPRKIDNTRYRVDEFLKEYRLTPMVDNMIANVGTHHMVAIIDKKVNDIWDSSKEAMHSYWVKEVN